MNKSASYIKKTAKIRNVKIENTFIATRNCSINLKSELREGYLAI